MYQTTPFVGMSKKNWSTAARVRSASEAPIQTGFENQ